MAAIPDDASIMSDDVFEDQETTQGRYDDKRRYEGTGVLDSYNYETTSSKVRSGGIGAPSEALLADMDYYNHHHPPQSQQFQRNFQLRDNHRTPSPSGYPGYKPPREALQMYAFDHDLSERASRYNDDEDDYDDYESGWKSYKYEDFEPPFDDTVNHKVWKYNIFIHNEHKNYRYKIFYNLDNTSW